MQSAGGLGVAGRAMESPPQEQSWPRRRDRVRRWPAIAWKALRHPHAVPWLLLVAFTAIYFSSTVGVSNSVDGPDYALTRAIVEHGSTRLDWYPEWISPDYAVVGGHIYAKRSPGVSLGGVPFYIVAQLFHGLATAPYHGQHAGINRDSPTEALTMLFPALCGALTVALIFLISRKLTGHAGASVLTAVCAGLGTLLWRYSIWYQRMPLYTLLLTLLFYLAITFQPAQVSGRKVVLTGLAIGYMLVTESTALFLSLIFLVWFLHAILTSAEPVDHRRQQALLLSGGIAASLAVLVAYNLFSFQQVFINLYRMQDATKWQTYSALFSTPLWPSIYLNLFSHGPIPVNAISPVLRHDPAIFVQQGADWAIRTEYDGLFFQSPYLFAAFSGFIIFVRERRDQAVMAPAVSTIILVVMSKFATFWGGSGFDGRYFVPMLPFLSLGLAFLWREILRLRRGPVKSVALAAVGALCCGSIYKGWRFALTNFGPHVTGDHRFSLDYPPTDWLSTHDWLHHLGLLWVNTFPNVYNLYMLVVFAVAAGIAYRTVGWATGRLGRAQALRAAFYRPARSSQRAGE